MTSGRTPLVLHVDAGHSVLDVDGTLPDGIQFVGAISPSAPGGKGFVDPGDAKAAACGPVLAGARARAMRTDKGKRRDDVGNGAPAKSEEGEDKAAEKQAQRRRFTGP